MTFREGNLNIKYQNQAGVTLMLAVLILSAITAIVFSLATIVVIEIRNAGDNLRTEPALYATLGMTETALMQYRRNIPTNIMDIVNCTSGMSGGSGAICRINNVTLNPTRVNEESSPFVRTVRPNERVVIPMYMPQDFPDQPLYSDVQFSILQTRTNGALNVIVKETTIANVVNLFSMTMDEFSQPNWSFSAFSPRSQYEIILDNTGRPNPVTLSIESFGPDGSPKGIPFIDQKVFRVLSTYLGLTRTYLVRIPEL